MRWIIRRGGFLTGALLLEEGEVIVVEVLVLLLGSLEGLGLAAWCFC